MEEDAQIRGPAAIGADCHVGQAAAIRQAALLPGSVVPDEGLAIAGIFGDASKLADSILRYPSARDRLDVSAQGREPRGTQAAGVGDHDGEGAEHLRPVAQHAGLDLDRLRRARERIAVDLLANAVEQGVSCQAELAADDDAGRVQEVAQVGDGAADRPPRVVDDPLGRQVAVGDEVEQLAQRQVGAVRGAEEGDERSGGRDRLQAAAAPAAANGSLRAHLDVPQLAGDAGRAVIEAAAEHEPGADAGRHHHVDDVCEPPPCAEGDLRERTQVGVVVELDRNLQPAGELFARLDACPAREHGRADDPLLAVDGRRRAPSRSDHAAALDARLGQHARRPVRPRRRETPRGAVHVELDEALGQDGRGEVGHGDAHVPVAEVEAEGGSRRGVEAEEHRRPAASARLRPRAACSTIRPRPCRSETSVATVVRERPVIRARSLLLAVPERRSASTTRSRFSSRSVPKVPSSTAIGPS